MYLGVTAEIQKWNEDHTEFSIIMDNPLEEFVMLPVHLKQTLWYSNLLCGVLKGALEMVSA